MKPVRIVMSAFGSYADVETVDFSKVEHGIFLITGSNGAGKTTIFDAITYALYDKTSGGTRDGIMMRSQYANPLAQTFVEFTFEYNKKIYTVRRNPKYLIRSKKKNKDGKYGMTSRAAKVSLIMPDGVEFVGRIKETDAKIVEIIGLNAEQFTQIAMIAQGEFRKLLLAKSDERKIIFSRIFNTKIYYKIQEEIKRREKQLYITLEDNKKMCIHEMEAVECVKDSEYRVYWENMPHFSESSSESILEILENITNEAYQKESAAKIQLDNSQKKLDEVKSEIAKAGEINQLFDSLSKAQNIRAVLLKTKDQYLQALEESSQAKKALKVEEKEKFFIAKQKEVNDSELNIQVLKKWFAQNKDNLEQIKNKKVIAESELNEKSPRLNKEIIRLKDMLPKYAQYASKQKELKKLQKQLEDIKQKAASIENVFKDKEKNIEKLVKDQECLEKSQTDLIVYSQKIKDITNDLNSLKDLKKSIIDYENVKALEAEHHKKLDKSLEKFKETSKLYEQMNIDFIAGQAGIIAKELVDGEPCPVCGSKIHPDKAVLSLNFVTKKDVDEAKIKRENADKVLQECNIKYQQVLQQLKILNALVIKEGTTLIGIDFENENIALEEKFLIVKEKLEILDRELSIQNKLLKTAQCQKDIYEKNQILLTNNKKELLELESDIRDLNKKVNESEEKCTIINKETEMLYELLPQKSEEKAIEKLNLLESELKTLEKNVQKIIEEYRSLADETEKKNGKFESEESLYERLKKERDLKYKEYADELSNQQFADEVQYKASIKSQKNIDELDNKCLLYREKTLKIEENIKSLSKQTQGKSRIVIEELKEQISILSAENKKLSADEKNYYGIHKRNNEALEKVKLYLQKREELIENYNLINRLNKTANGSLNQTAKLDFLTYIQRRYFESIIYEANKRLVKMTSNQFILQCKGIKDLGAQGSVGLDLDVYSMVTDSVRDVKTLSGGESFIAALAMALGTADIIQNTAGKIHMDMMFIDEGFGSLDDNSRQQAISILNELAQDRRLVGIISHVSELKESLDRKLIVTKTDRGSHVRWELDN